MGREGGGGGFECGRRQRGRFVSVEGGGFVSENLQGKRCTIIILPQQCL